MNIKTLKDIPPWQWPENAGKMFLDVLLDDQAHESDRLLAAELAGDSTVISDELADALLSILCNPREPDGLRGQAAISLVPALEYADVDGFEDPDEVPITEPMFRKIQETLHKLYMDAQTPKVVRRTVLEASVRAPEKWHKDAVAVAYRSEDEDWKLTAVFCMQFIRGFDNQILESFVGKESDLWAKVEKLIAAKHPKQYDKAISVLRDLRDLADMEGRSSEFLPRMSALYGEHERKTALLDRFRKAKLPG